MLAILAVLFLPERGRRNIGVICVATIVGLREAHGVPGGRAVAAVLVPYLVVACCLMMLLPVLMASTIAALQ